MCKLEYSLSDQNSNTKQTPQIVIFCLKIYQSIISKYPVRFKQGVILSHNPTSHLDQTRKDWSNSNCVKTAVIEATYLNQNQRSQNQCTIEKFYTLRNLVVSTWWNIYFFLRSWVPNFKNAQAWPLGFLEVPRNEAFHQPFYSS